MKTLLRCHLNSPRRALSSAYQHTPPAVTCGSRLPYWLSSERVRVALTGPFSLLPAAALPPFAARCGCSREILFPIIGFSYDTAGCTELRGENITADKAVSIVNPYKFAGQECNSCILQAYQTDFLRICRIFCQCHHLQAHFLRVNRSAAAAAERMASHGSRYTELPPPIPHRSSAEDTGTTGDIHWNISAPKAVNSPGIPGPLMQVKYAVQTLEQRAPGPGTSPP